MVFGLVHDFDTEGNVGPGHDATIVSLSKVITHGGVLRAIQHVTYVLIESQPQRSLGFPDVHTIPTIPPADPTSNLIHYILLCAIPPETCFTSMASYPPPWTFRFAE